MNQSSPSKEQAANGSFQNQTASKKINTLKCNRMVDEVSLVFSQGFKKIQEFEKESGSQVRIADLMKEYQRVMDSMRDIAKKASLKPLK